jgi:uncharacterized membrane protein YcaP (DUF421 family)
MFHFGTSPLELVVRSVVIYLALLIALRLFGKREVGQFTLYDLVLVLLVANSVQPAVTGPDSSVGGGLIIIVTLVVVNFAISQLDRFPRFHRIFTPAPTVILQDGKCLTDRLRREGIDQEEVEMAMREHGIDDMKEVKLAVLESDGSISIVPKEAKVTRTKRRLRYHRRT